MVSAVQGKPVRSPGAGSPAVCRDLPSHSWEGPVFVFLGDTEGSPVRLTIEKCVFVLFFRNNECGAQVLQSKQEMKAPAPI